MAPGGIDEDIEMWRLKSCPKCKGDMLIDRDHIAWFEWCLQCGYRHDFQNIEWTGQPINFLEETKKCIKGKTYTRVS